MADFPIPETPSFTENVRQFETTDPAHADLFNAVVQTLLENDVFLKKVTDALQERKADKENLTSCWHDSSFEMPGWYRIARCSNPSCVSCTINLKRTYSTVNNEYHKLELISAYRKSRFEAVADTVNDHNRLITKVRHVLTAKDTGADKENFIDFYYDSTNRNSIMAIIENCLHNGDYPGGAWQMLDEPQKVPETTEGETVLASIHTFENYWVGNNPSPGEIGAVATEAGSKYSIKYYTDKAFSDLDMFPLESEYGNSFIRVFSGVFDGIVVENSSGSGNYASQLYLSSDGMKFRKRQDSKTYKPWVDGANELPLPLAKGGTGKTTAADAANVLINGLGVGTDAPQDEDAFISQWAGGGKGGQNTYYRRPVSKLWDYIKSKLKAVATSGSYNDLSDKPSIGNGTVTIKQNGANKGSFSMNQTGNTEISLTDNNTTYGNMKGASTSAAGGAGLAPAPAAGAANRYLRSDGTWQVPPDNNTTYGAATQSANGLMTAADKKKLDGIASGANAYALPAASPTVRGGVKTGYSANGKNYPVQVSSEKMFVNVPWTDTNTNTWKANTKDSEGYVTKGSGQANKVWKTDGSGNPAWRDDANTTYNVATQSANGLLSYTDKRKLDAISSPAYRSSLPPNALAKDSVGFYIVPNGGFPGVSVASGAYFVVASGGSSSLTSSLEANTCTCLAIGLLGGAGYVISGKITSGTWELASPLN